MLAVVAAVAVALGPPSATIHSNHHHLAAARGSFCWISPPAEDGTQRGVCADTVPPVTERSLPVRSRGRVRIDMHTETDSLTVSLRGRRGKLRVRRVGESERRFVARLPRQLRDGAVLELFARYPQGDGFFGARLHVP
jgi:hypothetical protein